MPPACQIPEKSGLPSAVRFIGAGACANEVLHRKIVRTTALKTFDMGSLLVFFRA
jgi:hypothetical protein